MGVGEGVEMKISTKGRYGIRAMVDLASRCSDKPTYLGDVAESQGISRKYLEQIFSGLRKAGLVRGVRGAAGGYELTKEPELIRIGDIIRAVEGPIVPVDCVDNKILDCPMDGKCAAQTLWLELAHAMEQVLDGKTLQDMMEAQSKMDGASCPMYYI